MCSYCGVDGHTFDTCPERLEDKFGTADLREEETRDDDNTHARRNAKQHKIADRELGDAEADQ